MIELLIRIYRLRRFLFLSAVFVLTLLTISQITGIRPEHAVLGLMFFAFYISRPSEDVIISVYTFSLFMIAWIISECVSTGISPLGDLYVSAEIKP